MTTIVWHKRTRRQMQRIPEHSREMIFSAVDRLAAFPQTEGLDIKPLKNHRYGYRLRVGRYRVLFDHREQVEILYIQEVLKRDERTY